jgi:formylglycine-generating enzyme required for sulfatase activity
MDQKNREIITSKTSITTQLGGLASRGLQIANKLAEQNAKTVKQSIEESYFTNSLGMKFRLIPAGTFIMGSPKTEEDRKDNEVQHEVTISKAFWMGVYQVTQMQYEKVMGTNPSFFQGNEIRGSSSNHPVELVSSKDAVEFCMKLADLAEEKAAFREYRLPTEAEWEYACRAGSTTAFSFGDDSQSLGEYAWFEDNSNNQTHPVGEKKANAWGLCDMHGNVFEWCSDWYNDYLEGAVCDPVGPRKGSYREGRTYFRVGRGGSYYRGAASGRSAFRIRLPPTVRGGGLGFRVALSLPSRTPEYTDPHASMTAKPVVVGTEVTRPSGDRRSR